MDNTPDTTNTTKLIVEYKVMKAVPFLWRNITHYWIFSPPILGNRGSRAGGHEYAGVCDSCP